MKLLLILFSRWRVIGKDNVPASGPFIVVANHLTLADPPLLSASIPRRITFMAKKEAFRSPILGPLVRGWRAFPVQRGQLNRDALRRAQQVLDRGMVIGMFPEGARSVTAKMQPAYPGTSLVALHSGAPVLPVGITGTESLGHPLWVFRRPRITVNIGEPLKLPAVDGRLNKEELARATDLIMGHIAELLPPSYRGVYANKENAVADRKG